MEVLVQFHKSVVMVIGESTSSRAANRAQKTWLLGGQPVIEVDEQHHQGIITSVFNTTVHNTSERCSSCRSAFYALNSVGSRFGSLHPVTSSRLYQSLCLPILLYGSEISVLTKSEVIMMERVHNKILRSVQGIPIRYKISSLSSLIGCLSIKDLIMHHRLSFIISLVNLEEDCLAR